MDTLYTDATLADLLGAHESKVAEWRRRYSWPHLKIGREVRYTEANVEAIVRQHGVTTADKPMALPGQTELSSKRSA